MTARFRPDNARKPGTPVYAGPFRNGTERRALNQPSRLEWRRVAPGIHIRDAR